MGGVKSLELEGDSIRAVVDALVERTRRSASQLLTDDGDLNRFVNVYVNGQDVRYLAGSTRRSPRPTRSASCRRWPAADRWPSPGGWTEADDWHAHAHAHEALTPHGGRYGDILEAIGHTPLVEIPRMSPEPVRAHLRQARDAQPDRLGQGPRREVPDRGPRVARPAARADSIILEPTSGNTGIALAMIGRRKGYRVALVMPDNVTNERRQMAALFGAEVIDSPGALGSNGAIALAKHLVSKDERFVMPYQYGNPANPLAHYETTGPEILADCPEIDVFVAGLGTAGTLMGVSRYLREHKPGVRVVAAEPLPGELVQGLRSLEDGFIPEILDPSLIDAKYLVSNRDAIAALRELVFREGIFAGPSCGAVLVAAARVANGMSGGTIVALLPDGGWKYLSAGTFSTNLDEMEEALEGGVNWW